MNDQSIKILEDQIAKLNTKDFDLEAWKSSSITLLARIFGKEDYRLQQIQDLKIDYSSWALRDASSSYNPVRSCKKIGKEILETSISELKTFGVERIKALAESPPIVTALEDELTGTQLKELKAFLQSSQNIDQKRKGILKLLSSLSKGKTVEILADILLSKTKSKDLK